MQEDPSEAKGLIKMKKEEVPLHLTMQAHLLLDSLHETGVPLSVIYYGMSVDSEDPLVQQATIKLLQSEHFRINVFTDDSTILAPLIAESKSPSFNSSARIEQNKAEMTVLTEKKAQLRARKNTINQQLKKIISLIFKKQNLLKQEQAISEELRTCKLHLRTLTRENMVLGRLTPETTIRQVLEEEAEHRPDYYPELVRSGVIDGWKFRYNPDRLQEVEEELNRVAII